VDYKFHMNGQILDIHISGALGFADYQKWRAMFEAAIEHKASEMILNLTGLEDCESAGIGMILIFHERASAAGGKLTVVPPAIGYIRHAFALTKLICLSSKPANQLGLTLHRVPTPMLPRT
jgi:anti-anti-sigma factor